MNGKFKSGEDNRNWKGGITADKKGYQREYMRRYRRRDQVKKGLGFAQADEESKELDEQYSSLYGSKHLDRLDRLDLHLMKDEAEEKLLKLDGTERGEDVIWIYLNGKKKALTVIVLASWSGDSFPYDHLPIRSKRMELQQQLFAVFNRELNKFALYGNDRREGVTYQNGWYRIPLENVKFIDL